MAWAEAFENRHEPFDWYTATLVATTAFLFHEQGKFTQALLYYRRAITPAGKAIMHEDFRAFVIAWMRLSVKVCVRKAGMEQTPAYRGPRLP